VAWLHTNIEDYLVKRVKAMGGEVRKVQWIGRIGATARLVMLPPNCRRKPLIVAPGTATHSPLFYDPAQTVWVELKAPGAKPRPSQLREHERMRKMGQRVEVIDSLEGVEKLFS
jgi:streptogramin lyase